ncbi:hypothetical protein N7532_011043 [Penicillium argentinense]|uniref:Uncharacterized protein n=1 Tax=Penicillium argentinense TaxID=1131581 RepID=A0A9W9EHX5_9EURO|nr:uncharacterized protein N7532_011043 [Penicillium argentinense]KAJ5082000.1 hypothetical protein N7532_011043 [Penicillium argentinense]
MAPFSGDGVLWLCLGVSLFFAVRGIATDLRQVVDLTEIKHVEKEDKIISEGTEEVLKLDTLLKLSSGSTSHDLRAAALRILSERSTKGETRDLLLEDLSSKDKVRQDRSLTALYFLVSNRALSRTSVTTRLRDIETYTALVNCLCNFLEEHTEITTTTISPILPKTRPLGEKKALHVLNALLPLNIPGALEAGIISRWLNRYPFPCALQEPARRQDIAMLMKTWWSDDAVMSSIFATLVTNADAVKQLRKSGLMGSMIEENGCKVRKPLICYLTDVPTIHTDDEDNEGDDNDDEDAEFDDSDAWMINGEETAGETAGAYSESPSRRHQAGNAEEQALRRRRREAMVLSEGGRPFGRGDIIQRPFQPGE